MSSSSAVATCVAVDVAEVPRTARMTSCELDCVEEDVARTSRRMVFASVSNAIESMSCWFIHSLTHDKSEAQVTVSVLRIAVAVVNGVLRVRTTGSNHETESDAAQGCGSSKVTCTLTGLPVHRRPARPRHSGDGGRQLAEAVGLRLPADGDG